MELTRKKLTISNIITISRLVAVPFIVYFLIKDQRIVAFFIMLVALLSDAIDGYVARKLNQETELGKFLDPLCDKISLAVILMTLLLMGILPLWGFIIIVARDFFILLGSFFVFKHKSIVLTSNVWGKIAGIVFATTILAFTLNWQRVGMLFLYLSIPVVIMTFVIYTLRYIRIMKGAG
jgi:CDP-diacylglycerol--glycerol-3-phosphate 3-phosphatidyltransferase